jgi:hypothetical protein
MADSTSVIDATSFIFVSDETGVTEIASATANTLVNDFSDQSEPVLTKSTVIFNQMEDIKADISAIPPSSFTPPGLLDSFTGQALNQSFASSSWLTADDAIQNVQAIKQKCAVLNEVTKYVDTSSMIDGMKGGVLKDAMDAIGNVADQFKIDFPSLDLPELGIGKALSDLANVGRSIYDKVEDSFSGPVSDIIEHGKGGLAKAQGAIDKASAAVDGAISVVEGKIASMAGPLKMLDKLTDCVDAVGGSEFAGKTDQMIDRSNEIYDKLGVESDPNSSNFGEFDENSFLDSIGGLSSTHKSNIKKTMNTYNKASNNAGGAVEKAKEASKLSQDKSISSLSSGAKDDSTERKKDFVDENVKVEVDVPAIPGGAPATTIVPTPATVPPSSTAQAAPPAAVGTPYKDLVVEYEILLASGSNYLNFDPTTLGYEQYKADLTKFVPQGVTSNPHDLKVVLIIGTVIQQVGTIKNIFTEDDKKHIIKVEQVRARIYRIDKNKFIGSRFPGYWESNFYPESKFRPFDPDILTRGTIAAVRNYFSLVFDNGLQPTAEQLEFLLTL